MDDKKISLLIIDKDDVVIEDLKNILSSRYNVFVTSDKESIYNIFKGNDICTILVGVDLPEGSGLELLKSIREDFPDPVRILIVNKDNPDAIIRALNSNVVYKCLTIPFSQEEVESIVDESLEKYFTQLSEKIVSNKLESITLDIERKVFDKEGEVSRLKSELEDSYRQIGKLKIELIQMQKLLERLTITDSLTGLYNRRFFSDKVNYEYFRAKRYKQPLSLLFGDLDNFKKVNDVYGHQVGDEVLRAVSKLIRDNIRNVDIAVRYGGEEIAIILPNTDLPGAKLVAERLREVIALNKIKFYEKEVSITISFGVNTLNGEADISLQEMIKKADDALYTAKKKGKNCVEISN
jgi:diguanylate cyclase (GGDEF)-like protein